MNVKQEVWIIVKPHFAKLEKNCRAVLQTDSYFVQSSAYFGFRLHGALELGDRRAQEFWDRMWLWENYGRFPTETVDNSHLVVQLSSLVETADDNVDAALFAKYDECIGRVLQRLTDQFARSVDGLGEAELKYWLKFGLRHDVRGHDEAITPIIDGDSLVIFRIFVTHALQYSTRHNRVDPSAWAKSFGYRKAGGR